MGIREHIIEERKASNFTLNLFHDAERQARRMLRETTFPLFQNSELLKNCLKNELRVGSIQELREKGDKGEAGKRESKKREIGEIQLELQQYDA